MKIPNNVTTWRMRARQEDVQDKSIYDLKEYNSASKIGDGQYLALRSYWVVKQPEEFELEAGIVGLPEAAEWLTKRKDWRDYLQNLEDSDGSARVPELGTFSFSSHARQQISRVREVDDRAKLNFTPMRQRLRNWEEKKGNGKMVEQGVEDSPSVEALKRKQARMKRQQKLPLVTPEKSTDIAKSMAELTMGDTTAPKTIDSPPWEMDAGLARELYPKVEDEQIVNYFLIGFLGSLAFHAEDVVSEWSPIRKAFNFGKGDSYLFQARTDGQLSLPGRSSQTKSQVIVEVKPTHRAEGGSIIYQATAQMAAWIFDEPDQNKSLKKYRRTMILQERDQIRLVIATYDADYIKYIENKATPFSKLSLLRMVEYGPWLIGKAVDMEQLGPIIVALTLQGGKLEG